MRPHLYKRPCPLVGWLVGRLVGRLVMLLSKSVTNGLLRRRMKKLLKKMKKSLKDASLASLGLVGYVSIHSLAFRSLSHLIIIIYTILSCSKSMRHGDGRRNQLAARDRATTIGP